MRNITGPPVTGEDLFGREYEIDSLWQRLERGEHVLMLAPRRVGKTSVMKELGRAPRPGWEVIWINLERGDTAEDCIAAILAALADHPDYRTWFEAIPFRAAVKDIFRRLLSVEVSTEALRVDFKNALRGDWEHAADQLQHRLADQRGPGRKLLLMLDELPIVVAKILKKPTGVPEADRLLHRLREMRLCDGWKDRVQMLAAGSIGLEGILRRAHLSDTVNDLSPFHLSSWSRETARDFLDRLGSREGFVLSKEYIDRMLDLLMDPVPFHVQLFFKEARDACRGDRARLSRSVIDRCFNDRLTGPNGTAHLDYYVTRLGDLLTASELSVAHEVLAKACRSQRGVRRLHLVDVEDRDPAMFLQVMRQLVAEGYLVWDDKVARFRWNLLRAWWKRYPPAEDRA